MASIMKMLKATPRCWAFKVHGGPLQTAGIPDIVGCLGGKFFALEVKRPGGSVRPVQVVVMKAIESAGGFCQVVYSVDEARDYVRYVSSV